MTVRRVLALLLLTLVSLVALSSFQALAPWHPPTPDLPLLVILFVGLTGRTGAASLVAFALVVGYLVDLFASAPSGLSSLSLGLIAVWARVASSRLDVTAAWHTIVIALITSIVHGALQIAIALPLFGGESLSALRLVPWTASTTALVAPPFFRLLARVDRRAQPRVRGLRML